MTFLSPALTVIKAFGGQEKLAKVLGVSQPAVCRWATNGHGTIPAKYHRMVLDKAAELSINLTADDLVYGRQTNES